MKNKERERFVKERNKLRDDLIKMIRIMQNIDAKTKKGIKNGQQISSKKIQT